ncbi:hypothetical protein BESB_068770 [Besnoitia besnoiti]|uniref:Peptidase M50B-like protein n=1 Tax=Besnoitia besnoiti TaxID=94643 RepID=A0A2A9MC97_BESBE|nr:hypothetical protein BESB_068770 [Besnoitia besnoiti]PFH34844.1 hypothetical protein BESB_068770 [Besnoitia besnoiti]
MEGGLHVDWTLRTCCERGQWITVGIISGWLVVSLLLWHCSIGGYNVLLPMKMLTVFFHEFGHATAAWLTCGRVHGIEVNKNEGGVTRTTGGSRFIILPAGYLGSCFWGMFFLLTASINVWSLRVGAGVLCSAMLLVLLCFARNCALRLVCIFFLTVVVGMWVWTELAKTVWPLRVVVLCIGVMNGVYSLWDIWDDTIRRKVAESDAYKCADITHCSSRLCGLVWALVALGFMGATVYLLLVIKEVGNERFE